MKDKSTNKSGQLPRVYIINLDRSPDRWADCTQSFAPLGLDIVRVAGVDGKELVLPHPDYDERRYWRYSGRRTGMGAVGCYFSHIKALRQFLESDEETALICEDDVTPKPELPQVLAEILLYGKHWDFLRLNYGHGGYHPTNVPIQKLDMAYRLTIPLYYVGGSWAYLVNRRAAERMVKFLVPMYLQWDHAYEQNYRMGLTTMMLVPSPIILNDRSRQTTIEATSKEKFSSLQRYLFSPMLPYRGLMTCLRWRKQIGTALWYRLFPPKREQNTPPCE